MATLVSLKNISLHFGERAIFDQAQISISKGDRIGLIGLNGQGKSTLFKILMEQVSPDHTTPPFIYDKSNDPFEIFLIPQEIDTENFKDLDIEHYYLAFYPRLYKLHQNMKKDYTNEKYLQEFEELGGWEIQNNYINYLKGFELENLNREVTNLSGGERKKMALSIGLSSQAEFLLWDEPTNHLDIETIERFEEELLNCNKTYMIISHDRYLLNTTTDKICHIERGKINTFKGTYLDYLDHLENKEAELQKNLDKLQNKHRRELAWMRQGIKARGTRSKKRVEGYHNIKSSINELKSRSRKVVDLGLAHSGRKSKILVDIENGSFSYGDKEIFSDINLMVAKNDKIALIGPNGAGKSTLIKIFANRLKLTQGTQKNASELKVIVFDQNRESLDLDSTPLEVIGEGSDYVTLGDGSKKHITSYLQQFLFTSHQINRPISTLSGGEKNRLQLAMFMKQSADLWVFDEPTNDLDIETIELLEKELKSYESAVIIIGHDRAFLDNTCDNTWLINDRKVEVFEGGYTQVAPYLEAIELEKKLLLNEQKKIEEKSSSKEVPPSKNSNTSQKKKQALTNPEKERLKVIDSEVEHAETNLAKLEEEMSSFDFTNMDEQRTSYYKNLTLSKEAAEVKLENLYEEWEDLNSKLD